MSVQERLMQFLAYKRISKLAFANSIGRSPSYVTNIVNSVGSSSLKVIEEKYPDLNSHWLLTGEGEMIKKEEPIESTIPVSDCQYLIPVLPIAAQAGKLTDFIASISEHDCEKMISPIRGTDFAIPVTGDSMSPEYPSGSKVLVAKINDKAFIDWGRTYVLDTCNGIVIKKVYPSENEGYIKCVSVNPNFPTFEVNVNDIYGWYRVLMSLSLK